MPGGQLELPLVSLHPHLRLVRQSPTGERQRRPAPRQAVTQYENRPAHAAQLRKSLEQIRAIHARRAADAGVTPEFVAVLRCNRLPDEAYLRAASLQILDRFPDRLVVAHPMDPDLGALQARLRRYAESGESEDSVSEEGQADGGAEGEPADDGLPRNAVYKELFDSIDDFATYSRDEVLTAELKDLIQSREPEDLVTIDVQCWCPEEEDDARRRHVDVQEAITRFGGVVRDATVRTSVGLSIIRATVTIRLMSDLADHDNVRRLEVLPHPLLSHPEVFRRPTDRLPLVIPPDDRAPVVALVDSGIREGHPLLAPAVYSTSSSDSIADATDEHGHGTFVASLVLHGSLEEKLSESSLQPVAKLISIRVLDDSNTFPEDSLWEADLLAALESAHQQGARVINVSIGDARRPYSPPRPTPLASALDEFIRRTGVVVIVSAGNTSPRDYPEGTGPDDFLDVLLISDGSGLLDPASSALAITVGGLAPDEGQGFHPARSRVDIQPVGRPDWPSPVTRVGPGPAGIIKPDVVAPAGSFGFDALAGRFVPEPSVQVVGANALPPERPLAADAGTSYAAPLVTHAAARALLENPELSGNGIRALLLASGERTLPIHQEPSSAAARAQERLTGFGRPDGTRSALSSDHRVVLLSESELPMDAVHLYSVALPTSFFDSGGWRDLTVALAFDPQTRSTRLDYLASRMAVTLYRGVELDEVANGYINYDGADLEEGQSDSDEDSDAAPPALRRFRVDLAPATRWRSRGANQVGRRRFHHKFDDSRGLDLILAVKSMNAWALEDAMERYALAVVLERDPGHREIYAELRLNVEQQVEVATEIQV
jgi:hypothetical protein